VETKTQDLGDEFLRQARAREYLGKYRRQPSDVRLLVALPAARSAHVPQIRFRAYPQRLLAVVGPLGFCFCGRGLRLVLA